MSDFFKYGSQGKEIDINQFKKELEQSGAKESDVKLFFNFFDADGNGKIENTDKHKELDKLTVFYNELKQAANTDGNDILDDTELANMFKNENTEIAKEMSKDTTLVSSIKSFLTSLNKAEENDEVVDNSINTEEVVEEPKKTTQSRVDSILESIKFPLRAVKKQEDGNNFIAEIYNEYVLVMKVEKHIKDAGTVEEKIQRFNNNHISQEETYTNGEMSTLKEFIQQGVPLKNYIQLTRFNNGSISEVVQAYNMNEDGSITDEDFISRQTITGSGDNQVLTEVKVDNNGNLQEIIRKKDHIIVNEYNGNSITNYDNDREQEQVPGYNNKNNKLHKNYQQIIYANREQYSVRYDGNGNTIIPAKNNDSPEKIAKSFGMTLDEFYQLNPTTRRGLQVAQDVVVSNEWNANSKPVYEQGTKEQALQNYYKYVTIPNIQKEIESHSTVEVTLGKNYSSVEAYAKECLINDEGYTGKESNFSDLVNNRANALRVINKNATYKKGTKITTLTKAGSQSPLNSTQFSEKLAKLPPAVQANVKSVIECCKRNNITDPTEIKKEIFNKLDINLFDSGKTLNKDRTKDILGNDSLLKPSSLTPQAFQKFPNNIPIEIFITDVLGLKLDSPEGQNLYNRISKLPQSSLDRISFSELQNIAQSIKDSPSALFSTVADSFKSQGVQIRTQAEQSIEDYKTKQNPRYQQQQAVALLKQSTQQALDIINNELDRIKSHPVTNLGQLVFEGLKDWGYLLGPSSLTDIENGNVEGIIKGLHQKSAELEKQLRAIENLEKSVGSSNFESNYKSIAGVDYNPQTIQKIIALRDNQQLSQRLGITDFNNSNQQKMQALVQDIIGSHNANLGDNARKFNQTSQIGGTVLEIAAMVYLTAGTGTWANTGRAVATYTGSTVIGTGVTAGLTMGTYTAGRETLNLFDDAIDIYNGADPLTTLDNRAKTTAIHSGTSFVFGFVGGASAQKLHSLSKGAQEGVSNYWNRGVDFIKGKLGTAGTELSSTIASGSNAGASSFVVSSEAVAVTEKALADGVQLTGSQLTSKILAAQNSLNPIGWITNTVMETALFSGVELSMQAATDIANELFTDESVLKKAIAEGKTEEYLKAKIKNIPSSILETLKEQGVNMLMLKAVSFAVGAHGMNNMEGQYETLDNSKVYTETVNGETKYVFEGTTGKIYCDTPTQLVQFMNLAVSTEAYIKASAETNPNEPIVADADYVELNPDGTIKNAVTTRPKSTVPTIDASLPINNIPIAPIVRVTQTSIDDYSNLPVYTQATRPENTIIMQAEGLVISRENGQVVGRLGAEDEVKVEVLVNEGSEAPVQKRNTISNPNQLQGINQNSLNSLISELRTQVDGLPGTQAKLNKVFSYLQNPKNMSQIFNPDCPWAEGCERNSQAFALICKELGLEGVETKTGTYTDSFGRAEEHMWTEVTIDSKTLIYDLAQKQALPKGWSPNPAKQTGYKEGEVTSPKSVKDKTSVENQTETETQNGKVEGVNGGRHSVINPETNNKYDNSSAQIISEIFMKSDITNEQADEIFKSLNMTENDIHYLRYDKSKNSQINKIATVLKYISENSNMIELNSQQLKELIKYYIDENNISIVAELLTNNKGLDIFNILGNIRYRQYNKFGADRYLNNADMEARIEVTNELLRSGREDLLAEILPQIDSENKNTLLSYYLNKSENHNPISDVVSKLKTLYPEDSNIEAFVFVNAKTPEQLNVLSQLINGSNIIEIRDILNFMDSSPEIAKQFSDFVSRDNNLLIHSKEEIIREVMYDKVDLDVKLKEYEQENELIKQYLSSKNIDFSSGKSAGDAIENVKTILSLAKATNTEINIDNLIFIDEANKAMQENLYYTDSRSFIPELLKEIKPEEQKDFLLWIKYCNEAAKKTEEPDCKDSDKQVVVQNIREFIQNDNIKQNTRGYIQLLQKLKFGKLRSALDHFNRRNIKPDEIDIYIELVNVLRNLSENAHEFSSMWFDITNPKQFVETYNRLQPIMKKMSVDYEIVYQLLTKDISDQNIEKVASKIDGISPEYTPMKGRIVKEMLSAEPEKFEHLNKWLHIVDKNIKMDLGLLRNTQDVLNKIIFNEAFESYWGNGLIEDKAKLYEQLINNTDIIEALEKQEYCLDKNGFIKKNTGEESIKEEELIKEEDIDIFDFVKLAKYQEQQMKLFVKDLETAFNDTDGAIQANLIIENLLDNYNPFRISVLEILATTSKAKLEHYFNTVEAMKTRSKQKPELYLNGEEINPDDVNIIVDDFYEKNSVGIYKLIQTFDKEAIDCLMRKRFDDFEEYLVDLADMDESSLLLLKELSNSCNIDGKPFMPTQKIEFIDMLKAYRDNNLSTDKIRDMVESGKVDIGQLNIDLFNQIMKNSGMTDEGIASIPKEKLVAWDTRFAHLLSKEIQAEQDIAFSDILRAGNLEPDFFKYLHDESNIYGQTNVQTRAQFEQMDMNYEAWIKPSKENEIHFVSKDKNTEQLSQIAAQITEDMNVLMQTPVKGFLRKQFPKCIKGDEFVIPNEYLTSKAKLTELVNILSDTSDKGQLAQVWKRAQGNATNPDPQRATTAKNTLTILDHLYQRIDDLSKIQDTKVTKTLDLTIKMWDRIPQKDIFQGNYSTCCIGMGGGNGSAMPHFILDTAYNMIELVDNQTGKTIGNALCYFIKGEDGKPAFIIDNIEINNGVKPSEEIGIQLRTSMVEYASKVSKEVTGSDDVSVYMSSSYNDVPCYDLPTSIQKISFLGDIDCDQIYMDLYEGWVDKDELTSSQKLLKLK